jgi:hypothetical protein
MSTLCMLQHQPCNHSSDGAQEICSALQIHLDKTLKHSHQVFQYGFSEFNKHGRGVLFYPFTSIRKLYNMVSLPLLYMPLQDFQKSEYREGIASCNVYNPHTQVVIVLSVTVASKATEVVDGHDGLFKAMIIDKDAHTLVTPSPSMTGGATGGSVQVLPYKELRRLLHARVCEYCHDESTTVRFKKCSRCRLTSYCSKDCQHTHWSTHKPFCDKHKHTVSDVRRDLAQKNLRQFKKD